MAFTDVMVPTTRRGKPVWKVMVKSSTSVKDYHRDDAAVQAYVMKSAGIDYASISLAYIDKTFVYDPGRRLCRGCASGEPHKRDRRAIWRSQRWVNEAHSIVGKTSQAPPAQAGTARNPLNAVSGHVQQG